MLWEFGSAVTPASVGGITLALFILNKEKISFGKGAAVQLLDPEGQAFAVGLSNYSARDLNRIKGRHTREIAQFLGEKGYDEVIHRDHMALTLEGGK